MTSSTKGLVIEVQEIADELMKNYSFFSPARALEVAVKIQHNRILESAYVVSQSNDVPSAFEKIAMEMEKISTIADSINDFTRTFETLLNEKKS